MSATLIERGCGRLWLRISVVHLMKGGCCRRRRQFRLLNLLDHFNREGLGIEVDFSLPADRVICRAVLDETLHKFGLPEILNTGQGSKARPSTGPTG